MAEFLLEKGKTFARRQQTGDASLDNEERGAPDVCAPDLEDAPDGADDWHRFLMRKRKRKNAKKGCCSVVVVEEEKRKKKRWRKNKNGISEAL